jgi:hypothetical protein
MGDPSDRTRPAGLRAHPPRSGGKAPWLCGLALVIGLLPAAPGNAQTPEQKQLWEAQRAQAATDEKIKAENLSRARAARKADPMSWVRGLDPLSAGGWEFRRVSADGAWAVFSTDHQLKRSGQTVTVWLRREFAEAQTNADGDQYLSDVEKVQYQCADERSRVLMMIYYAENDIRGTQHAEESDPKQTAWNPIVPGTEDESSAQWACNFGKARYGR